MSKNGQDNLWTEPERLAPGDQGQVFVARLPAELLGLTETEAQQKGLPAGRSWEKKNPDKGFCLQRALARMARINGRYFPPDLEPKNHADEYGLDDLKDYYHAARLVLGQKEGQPGEEGPKDGAGPMEVAQLISDKDNEARGIVSVLDPLADSYQHGCFVGDWYDDGASQEEKDRKSQERKIWQEEWLNNGSKAVADGKLFRHIYTHGFGAVLLVNWQHAPGYISEVPRQIKLRWVLVVPILHFGECIALITLDFDKDKVFESPPEKDSDRSTAENIGRSFDQKAAELYLIAQLAVAPLLVREATRSDKGLMDSVARALEPPMTMTYRTLVLASETLHALARDSASAPRSDTLNGVIRVLDREARRGLGHVHALIPIHPPFRVEDFPLKDLKDVAEAAWRRVIDMEANKGFGWGTTGLWLEVEIDEALQNEHPENKKAPTVPLPRFILAELLRELLSNAYHAVCQWEDRATWEELRVAREKQCDQEDACGEMPKPVIVRARKPESDKEVERDSKKPFLVIEVVDRGIGMSPHARARSRRFGFSGRDRGSGWGLPIIERQLEAVGAALQVDPKLECCGEDKSNVGGCKVAMIFYDGSGERD